MRKGGVSLLWALGAGMVFLVTVTSDAPRPLWAITGVAACVTAVIMVWHLTLAMRLWFLDDGPHLSPRQRRIKLVLASLIMATISIVAMHAALRGWAAGMAPPLGRNGEPIPLETHPGRFWLSISLHLLPGLAMIGLALWVFCRSVLRRMKQTRD